HRAPQPRSVGAASARHQIEHEATPSYHLRRIRHGERMRGSATHPRPRVHRRRQVRDPHREDGAEYTDDGRYGEPGVGGEDGHGQSNEELGWLGDVLLPVENDRHARECWAAM
ncbi:hypothetical protein LTR35_018417, partial [Friedmanniomyces endolithicus]